MTDLHNVILISENQIRMQKLCHFLSRSSDVNGAGRHARRWAFEALVTTATVELNGLRENSGSVTSSLLQQGHFLFRGETRG